MSVIFYHSYFQECFLFLMDKMTFSQWVHTCWTELTYRKFKILVSLCYNITLPLPREEVLPQGGIPWGLSRRCVVFVALWQTCYHHQLFCRPCWCHRTANSHWFIWEAFVHWPLFWPLFWPETNGQKSDRTSWRKCSNPLCCEAKWRKIGKEWRGCWGHLFRTKRMDGGTKGMEFFGK